MLDETSNPVPIDELPLGPEMPEGSVEQLPLADSPVPAVAFKDVSISFSGRPILEEVSFSVEKGQTLCILGRSGVGKSVALRILMGFLKPDSGSVQVDNEEITELDEEGMRAIRKRVTMVFQNG